MRILARVLLGAAAAAVAVTGGTLVAHAGQQSPADNQQPSLVEDFSYPGANAINASAGITLVSGDGHILYADCGTPPANNIGVIQVHSTDPIGPSKNGTVCFKVTAASGTLTLKVTNVYEIRGDGQISGAGHKLKADLTTDAGAHSTVDVNPSGSTPVGVGTKPDAAPTALVQLTASS